MLITAQTIKRDFEASAETLQRLRQQLSEFEISGPRISKYGFNGRARPDRPDAVIIAAIQKRERIEKIERYVETDISRIENSFLHWEIAEEILRSRYILNKSVDEAAEEVFRVRRSGCDCWQKYRRQLFRLESRAFEEIARQVR